MKTKNIKTEKRLRLKKRIRTKVSGTLAIPRLSVFKSNAYMYAQIIDDATQVTLVSASDLKLTEGTKTVRAEKVGSLIADAAKKKNISKVVFDRNGFKYTGRIKALADQARKDGLIF